jgi:site-specific DNA recombinase
VEPAPLLDGLVGAADVRAAWDGLSLSRRRAVVNALLTLTLHRTRPGARTFDPEAVTIRWRL